MSSFGFRFNCPLGVQFNLSFLRVIALKHIGNFMSTRSLIYIHFLTCAILMAKAADIEFDVNDVSHPFTGFGSQVWPGDMRTETLFENLNMRYMRMCPGGCTSPPTDATLIQMDTYVDSEYNGTSRGHSIIASLQMAARLDSRVILNMFGGPAAWLGAQNQLKSENFDDFARLWASQVYFFRSRGLPVHYIELANEPEGDWNIYIPGGDYNDLVKLVRGELDRRGLMDTGIIGPGLAYLYHGPVWINALDSDASAALAGWSTHAWDEGWGHTDALPGYLDLQWKDYFGSAIDSVDPAHSKPIIVTEFATGVRTYNGVTYGTEFTDTNPFAQRCYENFLTLVNNGANAVCYWEAANQSWQSQPPLFGLYRTDSTPRPVYFALSTLAPYIPRDAGVIRKTWDDPLITAAGFIRDNQLVLAFANSTTGTVNRQVSITGITTFALTSAHSFESGAVIDRLSQISFNYQARCINITLAPESTLTVAAIVNECTVKQTGDLNGDCRTTLDDYRMLASDWLKNNYVPQQEEIEDFESYADGTSLISAWVPSSDNVNLTLDTEVFHDGLQSLKYQYENGLPPYYSKISYWPEGSGASMNWTGYDTLSVWFKCTKAKEPLQVNIVNQYGINVLTAPYGIPSVGDWRRWDIDLNSIPASKITHIGRIDILFTSYWYGSGTVYFDDIRLYNSSNPVCSAEPAGDVDQNCIVDFNDLLALSENWLTCTFIE